MISEETTIDVVASLVYSYVMSGDGNLVDVEEFNEDRKEKITQNDLDHIIDTYWQKIVDSTEEIPVFLDRRAEAIVRGIPQQYIVLGRPSQQGLQIKKIGTKEEVEQYLKRHVVEYIISSSPTCTVTDEQYDWLHAILELKEGGEEVTDDFATFDEECGEYVPKKV